VSWFKKFHTDIPEVPDDKAERSEALARNRQKLSETVALIPRTKRVVDALNVHAEDNHYAARLRAAYGVGGDS
jgi:hypothetical protein